MYSMSHANFQTCTLTELFTHTFGNRTYSINSKLTKNNIELDRVSEI